MSVMMPVAYAVISIWATWCMMWHSIKDGIIGKVLFCLVALGALGAMATFDNPIYYNRALSIMIIPLAALGVRHAVLNYWRKCR